MNDTNTNRKTFSGTFPRSMDAKHRVTIPSGWLDSEDEEFHVIPSPAKDYLMVMPPEEFESIEAKIMRSEAPASEKRIAIRQFYGDSQLVKVDKQGRVLLPEEHCQRVNLQNEVLLIGAKSRFEIWSAARGTETLEKGQATLQKIGDLIAL